jgi:hypothetical protein
MADLSSQQIFSNGDLVTAESLNNIMSTSAVLPDVISGKTEKSSVVGGDDFTLLFDSSSSTLKKAKVNSIRNASGDTTLQSNLYVKNGSGGANVFSVASSSGNTSVGGTLGVVGDTTMVGKLNVSDRVTLAIAPIVSSAVASLPIFTDANKALTSVNVTGAGNVVMSAGPTITGTATIAKTAIGGATIGTNSLAVTGTSSLADTTATKVAIGGAAIGSNVLSVAGKSILSDVDAGTVSVSSLGIGTATPDSALDLGSNSMGRGISWNGINNIYSSYSGGATVLATNIAPNLTSDGYLTGVTGTYGASAVRLNLNGTMQIFTDAASAKTAEVAFTPTERLRIDSSGNVGIGTASPSQKLTVTSDDVLGGVLVTGSNAPAIRLNDTTDGSSYSAIWAQNGGVLAIAADESNTAAGSSVQFNVDGTERMRITSSGNVGIGTATPSTKLHVAGVITHSVGTIGSNANGTRTVTTTTTTPTGGSDGDIVFVI